MGQTFINSLYVNINMHKLQHSFGQRDTKRPVGKVYVPELPFGPNWVPPDFWRNRISPSRRRSEYDQPVLELPLEEPPMHRRAPPEEQPQRGVFIIEL